LEGLVGLSETREVEDHEARGDTLPEGESGMPDRRDSDDPVALLLELCQEESPQPSVGDDKQQVRAGWTLHGVRIREPAPRAQRSLCGDLRPEVVWMRTLFVAGLVVALLAVPLYAYPLVLHLEPKNGDLIGTFGGLPATLVLSNGTFTLTTPLGTLGGTYTITNGTLTLTVSSATGIYAGQFTTGTQITLARTGGTVVVSTLFRNHGAYVSAVARAAQRVDLPAGTTRGAIIRLAAHNQKALRELQETERTRQAQEETRGQERARGESGRDGRGRDR